MTNLRRRDRRDRGETRFDERTSVSDDAAHFGKSVHKKIKGVADTLGKHAEKIMYSKRVQEFSAFVNENKYICGVGMILFGVFMAFFGAGMVDIMFMVIVAVALAFGLLALIYWVADLVGFNASRKVQWITFSVVMCFSVCISYCCAKLKTLALIALASVAGLSMGFMFTTSFKV